MENFPMFIKEAIDEWVNEYKQTPKGLRPFIVSSITEDQLPLFQLFFTLHAGKTDLSIKDGLINIAKEIDKLYEKYSTNDRYYTLVNTIGETLWVLLEKATNRSIGEFDDVCESMDNFEDSATKILNKYYKG